MRSAPQSSSWNTRSLDLNLAQLTTSNGAASRCRCRPARLRWVHLEMRARASPEGAPALRLGQAAAPSVVRGPGCRWRGLPRGRFSGRLSRFDWIVLPSARAVSSVAFVGPRCGRRAEGPAASTDAAALKLSFGPPRFGCGISDREVAPADHLPPQRPLDSRGADHLESS
jgi:hypothetical protein